MILTFVFDCKDFVDLKFLKNELLKIEIDPILIWTDSKIVSVSLKKNSVFNEEKFIQKMNKCLKE